MKQVRRTGILGVVLMVLLFGAGSVRSQAQMGGFDHSFLLKGPWELVVQTSANQTISFPIKVAEESKPQKLAMNLPVLGTPIKLNVKEYLPDLIWEPYVVETKDGGGIVRLLLEGKDLNQEIWLDSEEPQRRSISSAVGRVFLENYRDPVNFAANLEKLPDPGLIGMVSVKLKGQANPMEFAVKPGQTILPPDSDYRITVLAYFPHYSRDNDTNTDVNLSDKPVNPALKVKVEKGETSYEKWLWARFPSFVHTNQGEEIAEGQIWEMNYRLFNFSGDTKRYIIVVGPQDQTWMLVSEEKAYRTEKLEVNKAYPFTEEYHFVVDKVFRSGELKNRWKNNTETLKRPAIVVVFDGDKIQQEMVLELGAPQHIQAESGTFVFQFMKKMIKQKR